MRTVVTGGLGFIGRAACAALAARGHDVLALDDSSRHGPGGEPPPGVELRAVDVRDADAVQRACRGAEVVLHLAAVQGTGTFYRAPDRVLDVNLRGVLNVADACAAEGVRRLFFSSSSEVYGVPEVFPTPEEAPLVVPDPLNPRWSYGCSKVAGELVVVNAARQRGFEFSIVRYHNVYGPAMGWDHVIPEFIRRLELGEEFTVQGDGEQARSFCHLDDAVTATLAAALDPGGADGIFNVGNPDEEVTINELVALLARVSGKPIEPRHVPFEGEGTRRRVPDVRRARERLRYEPQVKLEDGLARTYRWYAEELRGRQEEAVR